MMNQPRWLQDSRSSEHTSRWYRYARERHNHPWADTLRPGVCPACTEIVKRDVRLWVRR